MEMTGEYRIEAPRERVWEALNEPGILRRCLPGCEALERTSDRGFTSRIKAKVGPVSAKFTGEVTLSELLPPESYVISGEGKGGTAGFAKGRAAVRLDEDGGATRLSYRAEAQVGGKLAQIGSRLIQSTAQKMADDFFGRFAAELAPRAESEPVAAAETPAEAEPAETAAEADLPPGVWVTGLLVIVLLLLAVFGLG
jgi:carbon monoxide dehydrogenase subunit G